MNSKIKNAEDLLYEGTVYDCSLREEQIAEKMPLGTEVIPLQSPQLWCKYYRLMGRPQKVDMIEKALLCGITSQQSSRNNMRTACGVSA